MARGRGTGGSGARSQDTSWAIIGTVAIIASLLFVGYAAYSKATQHDIDPYVSAPIAAVVPAPTTAPTTTPVTPPTPVVYFVGDSFSVGSAVVTYPTLIAATKGWEPQCICSPNAGYVADANAPTKVQFAQEITTHGLVNASRIVVSGGYEDEDQTEQDFDLSVKSTVDTLAAVAPGVPVTFLSAFFPDTQSDVPDAVLTMNAAIARYAAESSAQYIDVTTLFYGRSDAFDPDGVTLNDVGQRLIADTVGPQIGA